MRLFPIYLSSILLVAIGCNHSPPELSGLYPVTVTVLDGGSPIEGVLVALDSKEPRTIRGCSAMTNNLGIATIQTSIQEHQSKGASPGAYIVTLIKSPELPPDLVPREEDQTLSERERTALQAKRDAFVQANLAVPSLLQSIETSPIELVVEEKSGAELTVDVSKYKQGRAAE